jgi:hypothetical protein
MSITVTRRVNGRTPIINGRSGFVNGRSGFVNGRSVQGYDMRDRVFIPPHLSGTALGLSEDLAIPIKVSAALIGSAIGAGILSMLLGGRSRLWAAVGGAGGAIAGGTLTSLAVNQFVTYRRAEAVAKQTVEDIAADLE